MTDKQQVVATTRRQRAEAAMLLHWSREGIDSGKSFEQFKAEKEEEIATCQCLRCKTLNSHQP